MTKKFIVLPLLLTTACGYIPYGGEVDFSDTGTATCVAGDDQILTGTEADQVRCTPQAQNVSQ